MEFDCSFAETDFSVGDEMAKEVLKIGQIVTIYEDPITQLRQEGRAILRAFSHRDGHLSFWKVEFVQEPGAWFLRAICDEGSSIDS